MKLWTTQNLRWSNSLRQEFFVRIIALTVILSFVLVAAVLFFYQYNLKLKNISKREAVQKIITNNLVASAKYGDIVYSRAEAIELGKELGLLDLGICTLDRDIFERVNDERCKGNSSLQVEKVRTQVELGSEKYEVEFSWEKEELSFIKAFVFSLIASLLISLFVAFPAFYYLFKKFHTKVQSVILAILDRHVSNDSKLKENYEFEIPYEFRNLDQIIESKNNELRKITADKVYFELAKKVSHDIRSPLLVLNRFVEDDKSVSDINGERSVVIRNALARINNIAEDLLKGHREKNSHGESLKISKLVESTNHLLDEKKIEFNSPFLSINLKNEIPNNLLSQSITISLDVYLRILSNVINNSFEAIKNKEDDKGVIDVVLNFTENYFKVEIIDNGIGIKAEVLKDLKSKKYGSSTKNGNGIGLSSAAQYLATQGGSLDIRSNYKEGCHVQLYFALDVLNKNRTNDFDFIFIDDENANHIMWKMDSSKFGLKGKFYKSVSECLKDSSNSENLGVPVFVDYYLGNDNGLEKARLLHEHGYRELYLCTSIHFSKEDLPVYFLDVIDKKFPSSILVK